MSLKLVPAWMFMRGNNLRLIVLMQGSWRWAASVITSNLFKMVNRPRVMNTFYSRQARQGGWISIMETNTLCFSLLPWTLVGVGAYFLCYKVRQMQTKGYSEYWSSYYWRFYDVRASGCKVTTRQLGIDAEWRQTDELQRDTRCERAAGRWESDFFLSVPAACCIMIHPLSSHSVPSRPFRCPASSAGSV